MVTSKIYKNRRLVKLSLALIAQTMLVTSAWGQDLRSPTLGDPITGQFEDGNQSADNFDTGLESNSDFMRFKAPDLKALVSIDASMDPFLLDASSSESVDLRKVLQQSVANNLDIGISDEQRRAQKWTLLSSYGKFLPNANASYRWQYLQGSPNIPLSQSGDRIKLDNPFIITSAGFTYNGYRGGKILFSALRERNLYRASKHKERATISDVLLDATRKYYELVLADAILQIRIRAVKTSEAQLELNENLLQGGLATRLDVLQAKTQLASDRQQLIDQQCNRRVAAIKLAELLNVDQGVDFVPSSREIRRRWLLRPETSAKTLVAVAIANRPELKQYEELRLAARKAIVTASSPLQPNFQFFGTIYGIGETLSNSEKTVLTPITMATPSGGVSRTVVANRVNRQIGPLYTIGYSVNWNLEGLGTVDLANMQNSRAQAREAMLQRNRQVNIVISEVRRSLLKALSANRKIEETVAKVDSSAEELRLASLRFQHGVGKNIDILRAQQDYTSAQIENAQALIDFDICQAQLLRDVGCITVDNLVATAPIAVQ